MSRRHVAGFLILGAVVVLPLTAADFHKIHASRRDAPGQAEVHLRDTDILYILEGTATWSPR